MGGAVYVDTTCDVMRVAPATPALKAWFKQQCRSASDSAVCADFDRFIRAVAENNENLRRRCPLK